MLEAHDCGPEILQRPINDTARTFVSFGGGAEDGLGVRAPAIAADRQFRRSSTVHVCPIIGFDGARRKVRLQTAVAPANTQPAPRIECHVPQVAGGATRTMKDLAVNQGGSANPGA